MLGQTASDGGSRLGSSRPLALGLAASAVLHAAAAIFASVSHVALPTGPLAGPTMVAVELLPPIVDPPPAVELPRPRVPVPRPATPEPAATVAAVERPPFIAHDVPPRLVNGAAIRRALEEGYPEGLPEDAVHSRVTLWLFVDESGTVTKLRLQGSSGFGELDDLAARVAPRMAYRPALHQGQRVGVWVSQPIRFQPGSAGDGGGG